MAQDPENIVAGEVLALSDTMADAASLAQSLAPRGIVVLRRQTLGFLGNLVLSSFRVPDGRDVAGVLSELRQDFPQVLTGPNALFEISGSQNSQPRLYARDLIGWSRQASHCGIGLRIGMVDTGLDLDHPALHEQQVIARSFLPTGEAPAPPDHGTAVATILIGDSRQITFAGLLPGAELTVAAIFHKTREGDLRGTTERVVLAIDWLGAQGLRLINLSLIGPRDPILDLIVQRASSLRMILVAAAGNGGLEAPPAYPAAYGPVTAVTAVDAASEVYAQANRGEYIDFAAPGVDVWSARAKGAGQYQTGTSFAVPFVTAALAARLAAAPDAALEDLRAAMRRRAKDLGAAGKDPIYGWGLIRPEPCAAGD